MTSVFCSRAQSQLVGPVCSSETEKPFGSVMGVLARLRFSRGSPLIHVHHELSLSLTYGFGVGVCLWKWRVFTWGDVFADNGERSVGQLDFLVFVGEPVRNPSGECQVNTPSAADPLVCPPGCLGGLYWSGCCLLCSCLLPGWEQLRGNRGGRTTRVQSAENRVKRQGAGGESRVEPVTQTRSAVSSNGISWKLVKKCRIPGPFPGLWTQNLHLNNVPS